MSGEAKRTVRNRTGASVFVKGHGTIPGGETADVKNTDAVKAAVEEKVLEDAKASAKNNQEGEGS